MEAATRSRNIVYSKLMMKKDDAKEFMQQLLVARYGLPPATQSEVSLCAEIGVFKGNHNPKKLSHSPLYTISLKGAKIDDRLSENMEDYKLVKDSKKSVCKHSFQFGLATADGHLYRFRVRDAREHRTWTNLIKFLTMFPHSIVPEMPDYKPLTAVGHSNEVLSKKDSLWPVYVMDEEVGFRCQLGGPKILVLEKQNEINRLDVYSMNHTSSPVFSCMHSEIRRIGKMGIFLYVEVGRRCRAGPGLLWLFFGNNNEIAMQMREILCRFLLNKEPVRYEPESQQPSHPQVSKMTRSFTAPMLSEVANDYPPLPSSPAPHLPTSSPPPAPPLPTSSSPPAPPLLTSSPPPAPPLPTSSPPPLTSQQVSPPPTSDPPPPPGSTSPLHNSVPPPVPTSPRPPGITPGNTDMSSFQSITSQQHRNHHSESRTHPNRPSLTMVTDRPSSQKHLVNSYHTLEPLQGSQYHILERPYQDSSNQDATGAGKQSLTQSFESALESNSASQNHISKQRSLESSSQGSPGAYKQTRTESFESAVGPSQAPQYHVLELSQGTLSQDAAEPALKESIDSTDSPKRSKMPYPYLITDLRNISGQTSPESPSHKSTITTSSPEASAAKAGMTKQQSVYHILEPPPTCKQSKQSRLEFPRSQRSRSERSPNHNLDTAQLRGSTPSSCAENPRSHVYHEVVAIARATQSRSSRSFVVRSDSTQSDGIQPHTTPPQYHVLETNAEPQIHQYDIVDSRVAARNSGRVKEQQHNEYNQLGVRHNLQQQKDNGDVPVYNTIGNQ